MFSRNVSLKLKANSVPEFTRMLEKEIIPLLRKQKGFQDEISFVSPQRNEAIAISVWDRQESAEAYNRDKYPEILKALAGVVEGTPSVETFEVGNWTAQRITPRAV